MSQRPLAPCLSVALSLSVSRAPRGRWRDARPSVLLPRAHSLTPPPPAPHHCPHLHRVRPPGANLRSLQLSGLGRLTDFAIVMIAQRAPRLTFLDVGQSKTTGSMGRVPYIGDESIVELAQSCGDLTHLCISGLARIGPASIVAIARGCPKLAVLSMGGCVGALDDVSVAALCTNPIAKSLTTLKLANCGALLTDVALKHMARGLAKLQILSLTHLRTVTKEGLLEVPARCRKLHTLSLASTYGDTVDDAFLSELAKCQPKLRSLNVSFCVNIKPAGVEDLARRCAGLRDFKCIGCEAVKRSHLRKLARRWLPLAMIAPDKQRLIPVDDLAKAVVRERLYRQKALEGWASTKIQVTYRGFQGRAKSLRVAMHNVEERHRKQERARDCATAITRMARGHLGRMRAAEKREILERSARQAQRLLRGLGGRRRGWAVMMRTSVLADATARIRVVCARHVQRGYRGHLARSLMTRMRFHRDENKRRCEEGALIIQGQWRKFKAHGVFVRMMARRRALERRCKKAALVIQGFYRRVLALRRMRRMRDEYKALLGISATVIQKRWRGIGGRRLYAAYRREMLKAARFVQRAYRGHVGRAEFLELLAVKQAWDRELGRAAALLQRNFRSHAERGAARAIRFAIWKERRMRNAATLLSRVWRGRGARRCARMLRQLRAMERRHVGRRSHHMCLRERLLWGGCASIIQAKWRNILALRLLRRRFAWRRERSAVCVQSCFRMQGPLFILLFAHSF